MGGSPNPRPFLIALDFLNKGNCDLSHPLRSKVLENQAKRRCRQGRTHRVMKIKRSRTRRVNQLKRRARNHRRPGNAMGRKVRILKKLVPNCEAEAMGMDSLFRETADYILALRMRVKVMQVMVNVLSGSDD